MSGAVAARGDGDKGDKGRVETTKVKRYWPGKLPDWAKDEEDEDLLTAKRAPAAAAPAAEAAQHTGARCRGSLGPGRAAECDHVQCKGC